ncbi:MAG: LapA family protein [Actinomycetia bacterium]|jgi:uncharacterized integral membrane protein|nr:LapA family protein [Actinomycetes bacterium]
MSQPGPTSSRPKVTPRLVLALVLIAVAVLFIVQNRETATVNLLWFDFDMRLWVALLLVFLGGMASGALLWRRRAARR